jgi:hypothetical protein
MGDRARCSVTTGLLFLACILSWVAFSTFGPDRREAYTVDADALDRESATLQSTGRSASTR